MRGLRELRALRPLRELPTLRATCGAPAGLGQPVLVSAISVLEYSHSQYSHLDGYQYKFRFQLEPAGDNFLRGEPWQKTRIRKRSQHRHGRSRNQSHSRNHNPNRAQRRTIRHRSLRGPAGLKADVQTGPLVRIK